MENSIDIEGICRGRCLVANPNACRCTQFQRISQQHLCAVCSHTARLHERSSVCNGCISCPSFDTYAGAVNCVNCGCTPFQHRTVNAGASSSLVNVPTTLANAPATALPGACAVLMQPSLDAVRQFAISNRTKILGNNPRQTWGGKRQGAGRRSSAKGHEYLIAKVTKSFRKGQQVYTRIGLQQRICTTHQVSLEALLEMCRSTFIPFIKDEIEGVEESYFLQSLIGPTIETDDQMRSKMYYYNNKFSPETNLSAGADDSQSDEDVEFLPEKVAKHDAGLDAFSLNKILPNISSSPNISCAHASRSIDNLSSLRVMFPHTPLEEITRATNLHASLEEAADYLIENQTFNAGYNDTDNGTVVAVVTEQSSHTSETVTKNHIQRLLQNGDDDIFIKISRLNADRSDVHHQILSLYKSGALCRDENLFNPVTVRFNGEQGVGVGLLKEYISIVRDMFETDVQWDGVHTIFEGTDDHLIPKCNAHLRQQNVYGIFGKILSHLILLSNGENWVLGRLSQFFKSLLKGNSIEEAVETLVVDDIPDFSDRVLFEKLMQGNLDSLSFDEKLRINHMVVTFGGSQNVRSVSIPDNFGNLTPLLVLTSAQSAKDFADVFLKLVCYDIRKSEYEQLIQPVNKYCKLHLCPIAVDVLFPKFDFIMRSASDVINMFDFVDDTDSDALKAVFSQYLNQLEVQKRMNTFLNFVTGSHYPTMQTTILVVQSDNLTENDPIRISVCENQIKLQKSLWTLQRLSTAFDFLLSEMESLQFYLSELVKRGYTNHTILAFMERDIELSISERTLKRWLQRFGIRRIDSNVTPAQVAEAILNERQTPQQHLGVRYLQQSLRTRHNLQVSRQQVADVAFLLDPQRAVQRNSNNWTRRLFYCPGPNFRWCFDNYNKLSEFKFCIHGCLDEYSRKPMWLRVYTTNQLPEVILTYYLKAVKKYGCAPYMTVSDMGWEALHAAECQYLLYWNDEPERHHHWGYSTQNVTIEAFWRQFRHRSAQFWIVKFHRLKQQGLYNGSDIDVNCLHFVYMPILIVDLEAVVEYQNSHLIRSQPTCIRPNGRPEALYEFPEENDCTNQGMHVDEQTLQSLMNSFNLTTLNLPDYLPSEFRIVAERWLLINNLDIELNVNDEQIYFDLRQYILS